MPNQYMGDAIAQKFAGRFAAVQAKMQHAVARPVTRRPNTKDELAQFMANPQSQSEAARQTLMAHLYDTYGVAARNLEPYINPQPTDATAQQPGAQMPPEQVPAEFQGQPNAGIFTNIQ